MVCTRGDVDGAPALGLGPIGVVPDRQGGRVGTALMPAVIAAAEALGETLICLLGEPAFYGRFGFVDAASVGVTAPDPAWGAYFQARPLAGHPRGSFTYAAPFGALGEECVAAVRAKDRGPLAARQADDIVTFDLLPPLNARARDDDVSMWVRATLGLRRSDGEWRIAHDHESVPWDPETGQGRVDLRPEP